MLATVEVLKKYDKNFCVESDITIIYTDHKNLLADSAINDLVFRFGHELAVYQP